MSGTALISTACRQAIVAREVDEAHCAMLVEALERGEDPAVVNVQLDHLVLTAGRRLADLRELLHVQEQAELGSIHARWLGGMSLT